MKKSLAVFFLLLVCAAALISASAVGIGRAEEQVTITSQTLAGDPAAAAGHPAKQPSRGAQAHAPSPMQVGNYARPQKEPEEPEGSNFISFFEKKDEE